jgi:hypothetical protein
MFFNKKLLLHENVLRAATAQSEEQGVDGGQGVAAGRTIQAAGVTQYIEFHSSAR